MKIYVPQAEDPIRIDSDFEGGTLDRAIRMGENWYFLELRPDTPYQFRFRIQGCKGHRILISFRCRDYKPTLSHWNDGNFHFRNGDKLVYPVVTYDGKEYRKVDHFENDRSTWNNLFVIDHTFTEDTAWVSSSPVYLYSDMLHYLETLSSNPFVKRSSIGTSRNGIDQPLLEITENPASKKAVYLISREDADEFTGSFAFEGLLNELTGDSSVAHEMRQRFRFFAVPMVGVDGVIAGSYHSAGYGYGGLRFHKEDCPDEIANVKWFARSLVADGMQLVLAGKVHGNWTYTDDIVDFMSGELELAERIKEKRTEVWNPRDDVVLLTIRPKGYFERFMLDEFGMVSVFGCHMNGSSPENLRTKGRDLMRALFHYLEEK